MPISKKKVALITSGYFPVPAAMGGAVEALDENLIKQNEIENRIQLIVFSCYNEKAEKDSKKYSNSEFVFVEIPKIIQFGDKILYFIAKNILKKKKIMSYRYILQRLFYIRKVAQFLHKNNYDKIVIENHSTLFMALKKFKNYKKYEGRYYYHLHNIVTNDYGCKEIIGNCNTVIGVSNYINGTLKKFLEDSDHNNYIVLRNKVDKQKFMVSLSEQKKEKIRNKYNLGVEDVVFLFCGRFNEEKGIRELLKAFEMMTKNAKLLIVGGYYYGSGMISPFEQEMYKLVEEKLKDKVQFTGQVEYNMMPEIYAIADVVVIPSMWDDPAPLTVIESLSSGKALITTDSGGIPEYADSDTSIILRRDNRIINKLTESMDILVEDVSRRKNMEQAALLKTEDWTVEMFYKDFCNILTEEI